MGDRARIKVIEAYDLPVMWMYAHWGGTELPEVLRSVLARKERWDDPEYLNRMILSAMVKGYIDGATGYGLGVKEPDNSIGRPTLILNHQKQLIMLGPAFEKEELIYPGIWSFEIFIGLPSPLTWEYLKGEACPS